MIRWACWHGLETITWRNDLTKPIQRIGEIIDQNQVGVVVVGIPRRSDGRIGDLEEQSRAFAETIKTELNIDVVLTDERYTSVLANRVLRETGVKRERRRDVVDQIAAEILLQDYLDGRASGGRSLSDG